VTILEVARTLQKLIDEKRLERPARTMRFIFPPEIEGTMALVNKRPDLVKWFKAVIHMDMVGGGPETKAVFHVTRGPMSLPSFVHDVAWSFAEWVNEESYKFAATGSAEYPLVGPEGGKEPLRAEYSAYTMGSDHDVFQDSTTRRPTIYLNDWPDRYIHTNLDAATNIDTTKLKRAAFIGAASGYFLAGDLSKEIEDISRVAKRGELLRKIQKLTRDEDLATAERDDAEAGYCYYEREVERQIRELDKSSFGKAVKEEQECFTDYPHFDAPNSQKLSELTAYARVPWARGPLAVFGYDFLDANWERVGDGKKPRLLNYQGKWGGGQEYAYEVLNLVDMVHSRVLIWEIVSSEYGPVPYDMVVEYLEALGKIGVIEQVK
jgi:hypothetical protein